MLQHGRRNLAALKDVIGVVKLPIAGQRAANTQRRTINDLPGKLCNRPLGMGGKGGLQDQILRLIAGDEHLGQRHHLRARRPALLPSLERQRDVGLNRPDRGV